MNFYTQTKVIQFLLLIRDNDIFNVKESNFEQLALEIFNKQFNENIIYQQFCKLLNKLPKSVKSLEQIPFLPISFFKSHRVICNKDYQICFTSSGTTSTLTSHHYVKSEQIYQTSFLKGFQKFYSNPNEYCILGLLPSYLERNGSSLIYMVNELIKKSTHPLSGFFLNNKEHLFSRLQVLKKQNQKTILIGVSFALLDFIETYHFSSYNNLIIMETGGMKGKRVELTREELHSQLKSGFNCQTIHSEYGMTELLSQAYSNGKGIFQTPPWMKILIRDTTDPMSYLSKGRTGGINVIDLANRYSCSFISTQDLGQKIDSNQFKVLGRFDHSDIRGCNLLVI